MLHLPEFNNFAHLTETIFNMITDFFLKLSLLTSLLLSFPHGILQLSSVDPVISLAVAQ